MSTIHAIHRQAADSVPSGVMSAPPGLAKHDLVSGLCLLLSFVSILVMAALLSFIGARSIGLVNDGGGLSLQIAAWLAGAAAVNGAVLAAGAWKIRAASHYVDLAYATACEALAKAIDEPILRLDSSGVTLSASRGAHEAMGVDAEELIGRSFVDRLHIGDRPSLLQAIGAASQRERTIRVTLRLRNAAQRVADVETGAPEFFPAELLIHRFAGNSANAAARDGDAVICVIKSLAKGDGDAAERAGAEADHGLKDRLLANVSHELRTPLNAIIGFSEILGSAELAPRDAAKQLEYAGIIHASAQHLLSVVNLILDMSKIEARRFAILPEPFDVAPLIASCCDMVRLKASEGGVELFQASLETPGELIADKRACRQILINLLSNAVKFTKPGGRVTIGARVEGDCLLIYVDDTGIGIAPGHFAKLGNPFFQVRSSYDRMFEGTGLGLSLVRGLVGLHGGSLSLESVVEEGTRIAVRLPLDCRGRAGADSAPAPIEAQSSLTRSAPIAFPTAAPAHSAHHVTTKEKRIA